jgi:nicotinamide phosphoribosyltransferase
MNQKRLPNIILLTDSYKLTHAPQYPQGTTKVYSYLESRGGAFKSTVFFGLQYYLEKYLKGQILEQWMIDEAAEFCEAHFGNADIFNRAGWQHLLDKHGGTLPVSIRAVPEGTVVHVKNVLATVENTDDEFPWLTNVLETLLLKVWYPITVATLSREAKKMIDAGLEKSADNCDGLPFKLHDFGYRGVSSEESAELGAAAHLVNFMGTDTVAGLLMLRDVYDEPMAGFSIPASEHSTITSWGRDREVDAYRNMLKQYPRGLVACVSDSYNIYDACENLWGDVLKEEVLARDGTLVIRPDSGKHTVVLPKLLNILWDRFGGHVNSKGYKVLDPHVRVIWGDGINIDTIPLILDSVMNAGYSVDNLALGMGGALLQMVNRDTQKFAFKCSMAVIDGEEIDVYKDPIDDHGKISKKGRQALLDVGCGFVTVSGKDATTTNDSLVEVFRDGQVLVRHKLSDVRARASL